MIIAETPYTFRTKLKELWKKMSPIKRKVARRRPTYRIQYSFLLERRLKRIITKKNSKIWNYFYNWFMSKYPVWKKQFHNLHKDSWESELDIFLRDLEKFVAEIKTDPLGIDIDLKPDIDRLTYALFEWNKGEFGAILERLVGESFYGGELWWEGIRREWERVFAERTKKVVEGFVSEIKESILTGFKEEKSFEEILAEIRNVGTNFTEYKANFIARDLTGRLNGLIQKNIQLGVGIKNYIWQTMADERVRGRPGGKYPNAPINHWIMEGKICDWENKNVYSDDGIEWKQRTGEMPIADPGEEFQCRCQAAGWIGNLIDDMDEEIKREKEII